MFRLLKLLGFGLCAAAVLSTAAATSAFALSHTFDSEISDTYITAAPKSTHQVVVAIPKVEQIECTSVSIVHTNNEKGEEVINDGTLLGTTKEPAVYIAEKLNVRFTYQGCEYVKKPGTAEETRGPAYVEFGECYYAFENVTDASNHASVNIHCPKGGKVHISITSSKVPCMTMSEQTVTGINYNNTNFGGGTSRDFDIAMTMTGTVTESEGILCGTGKHTEGTYNGEVTISGTNKNVGGVQQGVWIT